MTDQSKAITPAEFALCLRRMLAAHEEGYNEEGYYELSWSEAAEFTVPEEWRAIATCLGVAGYCDVWEWCDRALGAQG